MNKTVIDTGKIQGHYISSTQIEKLRERIDALAMVAADVGQDTSTTSEFDQ